MWSIERVDLSRCDLIQFKFFEPSAIMIKAHIKLSDEKAAVFLLVKENLLDFFK